MKPKVMEYPNNLLSSYTSISSHLWSFAMYERPILDDEPKPHFAGKIVQSSYQQCLAVSHVEEAEFVHIDDQS